MIFPEMLAEMRRPWDFWKGMCCAQLLIFVAYLLYGASLPICEPCAVDADARARPVRVQLPGPVHALDRVPGREQVRLADRRERDGPHHGHHRGGPVREHRYQGRVLRDHRGHVQRPAAQQPQGALHLERYVPPSPPLLPHTHSSRG